MISLRHLGRLFRAILLRVVLILLEVCHDAGQCL